MTDALVLRFGKIKGEGHLLAAARHNKRELQAKHGATSHINARLSHMNYCIAGEKAASAITAKAERMQSDAGITKPRKDAVQAIEVLFSLPIAKIGDQERYFADCTRWIGERFGQANILSSDVHLDEAMPHCHVLVMPLRNGRMQGSSMIGGLAQLLAIREDFHSKVGTLYGLSKGMPRLTGQRKKTLAENVIKRLLSDSDPVTRSRIWLAVRDAIERDPGPVAMAIGMDIPPAPHKSFVEIFTGSGTRTSEDKKTYRLSKPPDAANPTLCRFPPSSPLSEASAPHANEHR